MGKLTDAQRDRIREEVRKEFPNDEMMQEIHFVQQVHYFETKDLSPEDQIRYYSRSRPKQTT